MTESLWDAAASATSQKFPFIEAAVVTPVVLAYLRRSQAMAHTSEKSFKRTDCPPRIP